MPADAHVPESSGAVVEIRVRGPVAPRCLSELAMCAVIAPRHTILRGTLPDRSALHGALERLRDGGVEIVDVRPLPPWA